MYTENQKKMCGTIGRGLKRPVHPIQSIGARGSGGPGGPSNFYRDKIEKGKGRKEKIKGKKKGKEKKQRP